MSNRRELSLREALLRGGVAPRYVRRVMLELKEHQEDLTQQLCAEGSSEAAARAEAQARIGSPQMLTDMILARPELQSLAHRRSWLVFGVLPVILLVSLSVAATAGFFGIASVGKAVVGSDRNAAWLRTAADAGQVLVLWGVPLFTAIAYSIFAARRRVRIAWPSLAVALVCALGSLTNMSFIWPTGGQAGQMQLGVGYPPQFSDGRGLCAIMVGLAVPLVLFALRAYRPER